MESNQQPNKNRRPESQSTSPSTPPLVRPVPLSAEESRRLANQMPVNSPAQPVAPAPAGNGLNHSFRGFFPVTVPATTVITLALIDNSWRYTLFSTAVPPGINGEQYVTMLNMISRVLMCTPFTGPPLECPVVFTELCTNLLRSSLLSVARVENRPIIRNPSSCGKAHLAAMAVRPGLGNAGGQKSRKRQAENHEEDPVSRRIRDEACEALEEFLSKYPCSDVIDVFCAVPTRDE
ncbi:hypothetical protein CAEBREN_01376 [Caenorhabditis brenneri]|uniref:Uncharacterized protein n=1 Tax=Caenorhabditis brenneri TaxID=135651 RepID=G0MHP4_CAEBE|nr:hypothetical protein CAEBREN_01376 [Caenorhabditis brenneri]